MGGHDARTACMSGMTLAEKRTKKKKNKKKKGCTQRGKQVLYDVRSSDMGARLCCVFAPLFYVLCSFRGVLFVIEGEEGKAR